MNPQIKTQSPDATRYQGGLDIDHGRRGIDMSTPVPDANTALKHDPTRPDAASVPVTMLHAEGPAMPEFEVLELGKDAVQATQFDQAA